MDVDGWMIDGWDERCLGLRDVEDGWWMEEWVDG